MSKILVVDDSMVIRKMINRSLESNHDITQAENGQEGFDQFQKETFDLIITDINMPIMNGFEFIEKVRSSGHDKQNLPIIVLSTEFSDDVKARGRELGVSAWMVKPTEDGPLNEAVQTLIERSQSF